MTPRVSTFFGFLALLLPFVTASHWSRRHQEVAHRARGDVDVHKRDSYNSARFTFYDVGLGACGKTNVATDWIVALTTLQFGSGYPGPNCFKTITIQYGGKSAQATIMDECMACPWGGLDFSRSLFDYFAPESEGVLYGTWWFDDDSGGGGDQTTSTWIPPSTTWEPPTTTSTPDYTPPPPTSSTPDYAPPTTSSTPAYTPPPTTSTSSTTSTTSTTSTATPSTSSTSATSINFSTGLVSGLAVPTGVVPTPDASNPEVILVINDIWIEFGVMLYAAEKNE